MALTIARHYVAKLPGTGLSPLQRALLEDPRPVRIASAPTGAGKSYAFERALADKGQRVLFIVPTRRLAQNLAAGLVRNLQAEHGWSLEKAQNKVAIWSSDATANLCDKGIAEIQGYRIRQLQALDDTRTGGEMVVAIPEVVSRILLRRRLDPGQAEKGIFDLLTAFEHIVFDEFHTIEARGFGLTAVCAKLAAEFPGARARVSLLSATPLAIRPVLERLGLDPGRIALLNEALAKAGRPIHGDVRLEFCRDPSLAALVDRHVDTLGRAYRAGRQTVIIYDKLGDLRRQLTELGGILTTAGIPKAQVLCINSIDDSTDAATTANGFACGRGHDPDRHAVIVATASVEVGVTFRAADTMFMEPGFNPLNFLQRYGRAARRGHDGAVWVRLDRSSLAQRPWLRRLQTWGTENEDRVTDIESLATVLCEAAQAAFSLPEEPGHHTFGSLPNRAAYAAGLYWNALMAHPSNRGHRFRHLRNHQPSTAKAVYGWLKQVREMEQDRCFGPAAKEWCNRFEALAYTLRDIGPSIRVIEGDGVIKQAPRLWLERETDILERIPTRQGEDGKEEVALWDTIDDHLLDDKHRIQAMVRVLFPHTQHSVELPADDRLIDAWCRIINKTGAQEADAWEDFPAAMAAAEKLVKTTGLIPCDDEELSMAAGSGVL